MMLAFRAGHMGEGLSVKQDPYTLFIHTRPFKYIPLLPRTRFASQEPHDLLERDEVRRDDIVEI
jgi:hypothetical protein